MEAADSISNWINEIGPISLVAIILVAIIFIFPLVLVFRKKPQYTPNSTQGLMHEARVQASSESSHIEEDARDDEEVKIQPIVGVIERISSYVEDGSTTYVFRLKGDSRFFFTDDPDAWGLDFVLAREGDRVTVENYELDEENEWRVAVISVSLEEESESALQHEVK